MKLFLNNLALFFLYAAAAHANNDGPKVTQDAMATVDGGYQQQHVPRPSPLRRGLQEPAPETRRAQAEPQAVGGEPQAEGEPPAAERVVSIRFRHSNRCMDLPGGNRNNGAQFQQYTCSSSNGNQRFRQIRVPGQSNVWQFQNIVSGKCLDLDFGNKNNGAKIHQYTCDPRNRNPNQHFKIVFATGDQSRQWRELRSNVSNKCIDVAGNFARIHQWACVGGFNHHVKVA